MNTKQPINEITWISVEHIQANDYNPNYVLQPEMLLLKHSILTNGWLQPVIINQDNTIIDGFHRLTLAMNDKEVHNLTGGQIPAVILDLNEVECKLLTIRINRAKGTHTAYKMHKVIQDLYTTHGLSINTLCKEIGANKEEIELLLMDNIFEKEQFTPMSKYSQAWIPKEVNRK